MLLLIHVLLYNCILSGGLFDSYLHQDRGERSEVNPGYMKELKSANISKKNRTSIEDTVF